MKALIVEDDLNNVELLCARLKHLDCQAVIAPDTDTALAIAVDAGPDFILLDLKLGHDMMGGIDLMTRFKATPALAGVPIVIHSVFVSLQSDVPDRLTEADYLLPKPFRFEQLKAIIEEIRDRRASEAT
ncbi:response regulator PleD [compost metagenome]